MTARIRDEVRELFGVEVDVQVTRPEPKFGDYATNVAMQLAGQLGEKPRDIAEKLAVQLRENEDVAEVSVAGPGFINLRLNAAALIRQVYARRD